MKHLLVLCVVLVCEAANKNIVQLAEELGATTLIQYVKQAGLEGALSGQGPFTVFAPTNDAFNALPDDVKQALSNDRSLLQKVLKFHVTSGDVRSNSLTNDMLVQSLDDQLKFRVNIYTVGGSPVVTVDGCKVIMVDKVATNGVIHVIDRVLYPLPAKDIPSALTAAPNFGTLVYAVSQGQLVEPLQGTGPFTLFAPNNAAFEKLPGNTLSDLLSNQTALVAVLKYHVVLGTHYSAGLSSGNVNTLEGRAVNITVSSDGVTVNNAKVVMADLPAENGVIHEIDTVLIPPN